MTEHSELDTWVTVAMFDAGRSSRAARHAKALANEVSGRGLVEEVADRLWTRPGERQRRIADARNYAAEALAETEQSGDRIITLRDDGYPPWLREIADPPPVLWVRGSLDALSDVAVAVVGSRDATHLSLELARQLARELSDAGVSVVSGLARGVDGAAHLGALDGAGRTVAVLGSGLSRIYPAGHVPLAGAVAERGAVISELPPLMGARGPHFPLRNRIISGLSRAVVVVEAAERSGSLITARLASEQNRAVLAVPGMTVSGRHRGCHALIKDGARLVETVEDILEEIRWNGGPETGAKISSNALPVNELLAVMREGEPCAVDQLAARMGRTASVILAELAMLEIDGRVQRTPGGLFMRPFRARRTGP